MCNEAKLDDTLLGADLNPAEKIAVGVMQERIKSLESKIESYDRHENRLIGKLEESQRIGEILIDKMLKAVDLTGRL